MMAKYYPEVPTDRNLIGAASKARPPIITFSIIHKSMKYFNGFLMPERVSKLRAPRFPSLFIPRSSLTYFCDQHWQEIAAITKCECAFDRKWSRKTIQIFPRFMNI
jgi:hypothetical protein